MGKSFTNIKGRTSNKKAAGQKKIRPRVKTAVTTRSIRVIIILSITASLKDTMQSGHLSSCSQHLTEPEETCTCDPLFYKYND